MLKVRVIPVLLWSEFGLVKGQRFLKNRRIGSVLPTLQIFNSRDVDELVLVDVMATEFSMEPRFEQILEFSQFCRVPFTVGGGIRSLDQIEKMLKAGADKVLINSAAYNNVGLIYEASQIFGSQCIVSSIDYRYIDEVPTCMSHSGTKSQGVDPLTWAKEVTEAGAGEVLITSIDRDGMRCGYDLEMLRHFTNVLDVPVIACGGAGSYNDMAQTVIDGGASAVAAASIFQFTELTPTGAKLFLQQNGIPMRTS